MNIVYLMECFHEEYGIVYKIGYTTRTSQKRLKEFKTGNRSIELKQEFKSDFAKRIEITLHNIFSDKRIGGEWFKLTEEDYFDFINTCKLLESNFQILDKSDNPFI
jgi:hypothetical protein